MPMCDVSLHHFHKMSFTVGTCIRGCILLSIMYCHGPTCRCTISPCLPTMPAGRSRGGPHNYAMVSFNTSINPPWEPQPSNWPLPTSAHTTCRSRSLANLIETLVLLLLADLSMCALPATNQAMGAMNTTKGGQRPPSQRLLPLLEAAAHESYSSRTACRCLCY